MPKVSVIVPVYNVAPYVERCARSLFEQTLDDLEILFVNDCTPDNSMDIIKGVLAEYPSRTAQTHIYDMPQNCGLAAVRRCGELKAAGDYIIHCDSDDWVDEQLYATMYEKAIQTNADIVVCDEIYEERDGNILHRVETLPSTCRSLLVNWYKNTIGFFVHNKLIKRSLYVDNDVYSWDGLNMWEDNGLIARLLYYGGGLSQVRGVHYHYNRTNINAMTVGYGEKHVNQMIGVAQRLTEFFESKPDAKDFAKTVKAFQFLAKINLITDQFSNIKRYNETFVGSESIIPYLDEQAFSNKGRFRFRMVKWHLTYLFVLLFKMYKLVK